MRLLIVTQIVDSQDPILGFFHAWLVEFAKHAESLEIICLKMGEHHLPSNVRVHSLGKETGRKSSLVYGIHFLSLVWKLRKQYDSVFVHMNTEYVVLAGWLWRLLGKKMALWYTHGTVSLRLRLATLFVDVVFTASDKSMRLPTRKKRIMGHGMNIEKFSLASAPPEPLRLVSIGRISRVKNLRMMSEAFVSVCGQSDQTKLIFVGGPVTNEDSDYREQLERYWNSTSMSQSFVVVSPEHADVADELAQAHVFLHASATGSLDKAPLEALLCGVPVITTNPEIASMTPHALFSEPDAKSFAQKLSTVLTQKPWENDKARLQAREAIIAKHSLSALVPRLVAELTRI